MDSNRPFGNGDIDKANRIPCLEWISAKCIVKLIAGLDIFYALLLIGLHLLTLITGKAHKRLTPDNTNLTNHSHLFEDGHKQKETLEVMIWVGTFAICILQLLVAGALYGGLKQREVRICIRNCRIWSYTAVLLMVIIFFQILGILIEAKAPQHILRLTVYGIEFIGRLIGLLAIRQLRHEIQGELCELDLEIVRRESGQQVHYYELQPTTPSPVHKVDARIRNSADRPSRRHYQRTETWEDLEFDEL